MLEKIKELKGIFYRKMKEEEIKRIEELPGFNIGRPRRIIELPKAEDITKLNVIYPLLEPFVYVNVKWDPEIKELVYQVIEPELTEEEKKLFDKVSDALVELVEVGLGSIKETAKAIEYLEEQVEKVVKEFNLRLTPNQYVKIMYVIYRNFIGYNEVEAMMQDPHIEDISCDGINTPIFVVHRKYGSIRSNVAFTDLESLREFVIKLAERCGRYVSYAEPILDGTLPDGSRVSATVATDVVTKGATFTIRKFGEKPFSPIEQIDLGTVSPEILAYFWYLIESRANMLIVGGTATGKTSFLNSVCMFIPPESKIVSIEDTREIRIPHEHWISGLARVGFGIPMPTGEKYGEVTMFDLLKESFRQNPDYVIVGETRGQEAYVMFQGMASGHASYSTFHAGSLDAVVKRLTTPPINLSPTLIESLNVVVVMAHAREKEKSARRIKEIVEIVSVDSKTEEVKTNLVFMWDPVNDTYQKVNDSIMVRKLVEARGGRYEDALAEIERRKKVVEWMHSQKIKDFIEVTHHINMYYKEPEKLFEMMKLKEGIPVRVKEIVNVGEKPRIRTSILELLGFKFVREKPQ
ncbi:type II/IV secretion system ATPase subunit [archaeon]|nr:type II/IV secretion system ATPase subunit [archaeon]